MILGTSTDLGIGDYVIYRRKGVVAIVVAFATTAGVYADMMPVSPVDTVPCPAVQLCGRTVSVSSISPSPLISPIVSHLDLRSTAFLPAQNADVKPTGETPPSLHLLGPGRSSSLDLCLYALMSLGLCKSGPWMKELSFGRIPDWYHAGGPAQIGHSYAVEPDCLCSAVVCFVQPGCRAEEYIPQHRLGTIVSLWRQSQFTPTALATRGPPITC